MKHTDLEHRALEAMARYGGGFAKALANAWLRADADNSARLRAAFPDLLAKYSAMAEQASARVSA